MVVCKQCSKTIVNAGNPATIYSVCSDCAKEYYNSRIGKTLKYFTNKLNVANNK